MQGQGCQFSRGKLNSQSCASHCSCGVPFCTLWQQLAFDAFQEGSQKVLSQTQDEDEQLARALAASMEDAPSNSHTSKSAPIRSNGSQPQQKAASSSHPRSVSQHKEQKSEGEDPLCFLPTSWHWSSVHEDLRCTTKVQQVLFRQQGSFHNITNDSSIAFVQMSLPQ